MDPSSVKRRLTCILVADAVGYSKQMGQDEEGTIRVLSAHRAVIDGIVTFHQGRIVSTAGDSVLAEFSSVVDAVRCAVEIQEALKTRNDSLPEHRQMHFRVGVNLGDVVVKNEDLLGDGVNVAARLESMAEPGGICISSSVYDQITGKLDLAFHDIGDQHLKNISRPIHVYRVSGASKPVRPPPAATPVAPAPRGRNSTPWVLGASIMVAIGTAVAWQGGWLRFGATEPVKAIIAAAPVAKPAVPGPDKGTRAAADANVARAQADTEMQKARADAEAMNRQAEAELAHARADAESSRASRAKADADAAATRIRAKAEADAARIRADAEAAAARTRSESEAAAQVAEGQVAKARAAATVASVPAVADKSARTAPGDVRRFDGNWNVAIDCPKHTDGTLGFKVELVAEVWNGTLSGERGTKGTADWFELHGVIEPGGSARLNAKGLSGDPKFSVGNTKQGSPFTWAVEARFFENSRGLGLRTETRACELVFVKQ